MIKTPTENDGLINPSVNSRDSVATEEHKATTGLVVERHQILLVEDSASDAELFQVALKEGSPRTKAYWVGTGGEALDLLSRKGRFQGLPPVKIVILDLDLPDQSGFDVLRAIRATSATSLYPVVIFSSSEDRQSIQQAYALGANAYFLKPHSFDSYVGKISSIVRHWLDSAELPV